MKNACIKIDNFILFYLIFIYFIQKSTEKSFKKNNNMYKYNIFHKNTTSQLSNCKINHQNITFTAFTLIYI